MKERNYYLVELDDLVDELNRRDQEKQELIDKMDKWLDVINYWEDEVRDVAERFDSEYRMYEKYNRVIDDIYNTMQKMKKDLE